MICRSSGFFKGAYTKLYESSRINTVILKEFHPIIFKIFLTWLELGNIESAPPITDLLALNVNKSILDAGYILSDFLLVKEFQNSVMNLLITRFNLYIQSYRQYISIEYISISYIISYTLP